MKIKRIEHVGIVVKDLEQSRAVWEECLGLRLAEVEHLEQYQVRIAMYPVGESMVELLGGTTPDSKYARLVRERGEGLHHICLEVEDIEGALGRKVTNDAVSYIRGIAELRDAMAGVGLTADEFLGDRYFRIKQIHALQRDGRLDDGLRWRTAAAVGGDA